MSRLARTATVVAALATAAAVASPAAPASADDQTDAVLVAEHGTHSVYVVPEGDEYPVPVEERNTYWGFVPLDGMCGFAGTRLTLSDMSETFFIQEKERGAKTGSYTGTGTILDESFELVQYDEQGDEVRTFTGTGDEYAQMRGTSLEGSADQLVNLRASFRGASEDGARLAFTITMRMRAASDGGEPRFSAEVTTCRVG